MRDIAATSLTTSLPGVAAERYYRRFGNRANIRRYCLATTEENAER